MMPQPPPVEDERDMGPGAAGVGAGGGGLNRVVSQSRAASRAAQIQELQAREQASTQVNGQSQVNRQSVHMNGRSPSATSSATSPISPPANGAAWRTSMSMTREADPEADPIDPGHQTMIKVGEHAYPVDLSRDPQANVSTGSSNTDASARPATNVGTDDDPLAITMHELQSGGNSTNRRSGQWTPGQGLVQSPTNPTSRPAVHSAQSSQSQIQASIQAQAQARRSISPIKPRTQSTDLSSPSSAGPTSSQIDYRPTADAVVGLPPTASRPVSPNPNPGPNPPTANFMRPPSQGATAGPSSNLPIDAVLATYHQSLPGERKSISSRPPSRAESAHRPMSASTEGHAGVGARGRSTSPQPFVPLSRSTSPNTNAGVVTNVPPGQASKRNSYNRVPPPNVAGNGQVSTARHGSTSSISVPAVTTRPTSPGVNSVGIAIDDRGRVAMDDMATMYTGQQQQSQPLLQQQQYRPQQPQQSPQQPPSQSQLQHRPGYIANGAAPPPTAQPPPPPQAMPPTSQAAMYPNSVPAPAYPQQPTHPYSLMHMRQIQQQQPQPQPQPQQSIYGGGNIYGVPQTYVPPPGVDYPGGMVQRGPSMTGYYGQGQGSIQQPPTHAAIGRAPSPQPPQQNQPPPTGQYTEDGRGVLFYGMASSMCCLFWFF